MAANGSEFIDPMVRAIVALPLLPGVYLATRQIEQGKFIQAVRTALTTMLVMIVLAGACWLVDRIL